MSRCLSLLRLDASRDRIEDGPLCLLDGRDGVVDCETCLRFQPTSVVLCQFRI